MYIVFKYNFSLAWQKISKHDFRILYSSDSSSITMKEPAIRICTNSQSSKAVLRIHRVPDKFVANFEEK